MAVFLTGCASLEETIAVPERPAFFEQEIRSKTWNGPDGNPLKLLGWTVIHMRLRGELLIAKFGDTNTGFISCLEFYRVNRNESSQGLDTYMLVDHDWGPHLQNWGISRVTSVSPDEFDKRAVIRITRETIPKAGEQPKRLHY